MTNKIVILDDSVILYEHYINDEKWERTLAFPRGGLTYLISNTTIKFYAYEDYFYRNCLISMQLPIYIVDEYMHIDGEYSDVTELTEILDRIFPTNDIDAQLEKYLKIVDAELLYQPIGDYLTKASADTLYMPIGEYVTDEELVEALEDYYTKDESDDRFQPKGDYLTKASADTIYQPIGDYATNTDLDKKLDASAYTPCDLSNYYTKQEVYNKTESDNKYQVKLVAGDNITISGNVISAAGSSGGTVDAYTKSESDARYQPKGDYATESWVLNKKYITSASTVFNNYYTTANTYSKTEINNFITNLQNQISALTETINECCSGTPTPTIEYRWVVMTGANDYVCSGYDKYSKEKKQKSTDGGTTWTDVTPAEYRQGSTLIESDSADCGYEQPLKFSGVTIGGGGGTQKVACNGSSTITSGETSTTGKWTSLYIGECVDTIGSNAFMSNWITTITVPSNIKTLKDSSFMNSNSAVTITLNEGLETIEPAAFTYCPYVTRITIPNSVKTIGSQAFYSNRLRTVIIGSGVTSIGSSAFEQAPEYADTMESVTVLATTPPALDEVSGYAQTFNGTYPIYVPSGSVNAYKTAWYNYSSRIQAIPE